ncbi:MAG: UvrB/UvrC motif-containing protein [Planctomycetota bacterium]
MKCQLCNDKAATIHLTEIEKGAKKEVHLCEECYKEKNAELLNQATALEGPDKASDGKSQSADKIDDKRACPICGTTLKDFQKRGLFGCPEDYTVFKDVVQPLLGKIHGEGSHRGKVPRSTGQRQDRSERLMTLRRELEDVIHSEMYERAAQLRDEIRQIEEQV